MSSTKKTCTNLIHYSFLQSTFLLSKIPTNSARIFPASPPSPRLSLSSHNNRIPNSSTLKLIRVPTASNSIPQIFQMPPLNPTSKELARLVLRRSSRKCPNHYNQIRGLSQIAGSNVYSSADGILGGGCKKLFNFGNGGNPLDLGDVGFQKRGFLGCGDGQEGNMLSKVYEERRVLGYSPEQLFNVVAAVDMYEDFLPWCQRSQIIHRNPDGSFDAELEIGFKFLVESYASHVELNKPRSIKTTSSQSSLFDHLINIWEFNPGPAPGTCSLHFLVDFKFQSPLYRQIANMFFTEVVSRLVGSFNDRCRLIYGPGMPVTIEQKA